MVCERLVDIDEGMQEWRYRHVKMIERTIGHKIGTGGSSGVAYLSTTLFNPTFPDLWEIRSSFQLGNPLRTISDSSLRVRGATSRSYAGPSSCSAGACLPTAIITIGTAPSNKAAAFS